MWSGFRVGEELKTQGRELETDQGWNPGRHFITFHQVCGFVCFASF